MPTDTFDELMARALELASRGCGYVEPNPMVGCVIVRDGQTVGEGWHQRFGGPHAEIEALRQAGSAARGATMLVTLEPCCHHGKTPPCADAVVRAGVRRVVVAMRDPFPQVDGGGVGCLQEAGIEVEVGIGEARARDLNAPYLKRIATGNPWVIAKWAMTLDGKIATRTGDSRWISNDASRAVVHQIRGRVDAILVGSGTARADAPRLTARPAGPRVASRIVLDSKASLAVNSPLVQSIEVGPVLVVATSDAPPENVRRLRELGCEVLMVDGATPADRVARLLAELGGPRQMTNILVEGGATLLGAFHDAGAIDEVHLFLAPKILGGATAPTPIGGHGLRMIAEAKPISNWTVEELAGDIYAHGRIVR